MLDFVRRHLGKIIGLATVVVVVLLTVGVTKVTKMVSVSVSQESAPGYFDDGKGLVSVGGYDQLTTFRSFQSWRNSHPDRFRHIISTSVSSYWTGAIVVYKPDSTTFAP